MKTLLGGMLLCLLPLVASCASSSSAEPVRCQHPAVQLDTNAGLVLGLLAYHKAVDQCNALNGFID